MIILIFTVGMAVKWYRYNEFAGRGPAIGYAYKYFNLILGYILVAATILFYLLVIRKTEMSKAFWRLQSLWELCLYCLCHLTHRQMKINICLPLRSFLIQLWELKMMIHLIMLHTGNVTQIADSAVLSQLAITYLWDRSYLNDLQNQIMCHMKLNISIMQIDIYFYLPAIIGMIISKLIGLGTVMMYFLSRFLMLAVYSVIGYFAIRKFQREKHFLQQ